MSFLRQFARVSIFHSVFNKAYPSIGLSRNLGLTIIPPSIHTMAKERAVVKEPSSERKKKTSSDKVAKTGKSKKHAKTRDDTTYESTRGASVHLQPLEDTSMADSLDPEDTKSEVNKKSEKKEKSEKDEQAEAEADKGTAEGGAMFFSIDTNPTPVDLTAVKVAGAETPDSQNPPKLNRMARRRIQLMEKQREVFRKRTEKELGEDSAEIEASVQKQLDKWMRNWDRKGKEREERKQSRARKGANLFKDKHTRKGKNKVQSLKQQLSKLDES
ncbi:hypothetical protein F4679DRAFT_541723 [Xylaria curta]|nr:hypothetical protein F4679DRAFT_541723 [Xylaria curta]